MYISKSFAIEDLPTLHAFIQRYSFATLFTAAPEPMITHLPLLLDSNRGNHGTLDGHFARPNPHWQRYTSVAVFHGPSAALAAFARERLQPASGT